MLYNKIKYYIINKALLAYKLLYIYLLNNYENPVAKK